MRRVKNGSLPRGIAVILCLGLASCTATNPDRLGAWTSGVDSSSAVPAAVAEFTAANSSPAAAATAEASEKADARGSLTPVGYFEVSSVPPAPATDYESPITSRQGNASPIDFSTALALVSGQNPKVAFAHERINEAFAHWDAAKVLWLPSLRAGVSYNKHEGNLQPSLGRVADVSRGSMYSGLGARAVGGGSPSVSGVEARFHLADAIFQPIIAERTVAAHQYAASAVTNDELLRAALAYLELLRTNQQLAIARATLQNAQQLAELTKTFADTGQGAQADADRAQTELSLRTNEVTRVKEATQVASARLVEVLSLERNMELRPQESAVAPIELVSPGTSAQDLIATGLSNRPELSESVLLISEAVQRLRREKYASLLPSLLLGMSYGGFGGAPGGRIDDYGDRFDFDAVAYWEVRNLGFGEKAAREAAHSRVHQARLREVEVMDRVAREVAESHAQVRSRQQQIAVAKSGVKAAQASYDRNLERIRDGQGLPIEVLQSLQALDQAQDEYLRAIIDYSAAQFRLHRSLGWPISQ